MLKALRPSCSCSCGATGTTVGTAVSDSLGASPPSVAVAEGFDPLQATNKTHIHLNIQPPKTTHRMPLLSLLHELGVHQLGHDPGAFPCFVAPFKAGALVAMARQV